MSTGEKLYGWRVGDDFSGRIFGIPILDCTRGRPKFLIKKKIIGAYLSGFEPSANTMKVEGMIAHAPGDITFFGSSGRLLSLAFDAEI